MSARSHPNSASSGFMKAPSPAAHRSEAAHHKDGRGDRDFDLFASNYGWQWALS